jgi:NAD(P)-dependent dehydrogenase (short-subunit alcohol dehydrogenase family)
MRRLGTPDEIAAVICFLSSDEASFCTGEIWAVDGGLLCNLKD